MYDETIKHKQVKALREVTDNGTTYPKGSVFLMEESLADAHAADGFVEIIGSVKVTPTQE